MSHTHTCHIDGTDTEDTQKSELLLFL